jgi:outer membrane lipoprotein-sorting protein
MRPAEDIERLIDKLSNTTGAEMDKCVLQDALQALAESKETISASTRPKTWKIIMTNPIAKLAAAAVVIIAMAGAVIFLSESGPGIALADVLARVEQARAFAYKMKMTMTGVITPMAPPGRQQMEGTVTISDRYGVKMETETTDLNSGRKMIQQMYVLPDRKAIFMITPSMKQYLQMEFTDDVLSRIKKQNNDPRELIKQMMSCKYTDLGRKEIDGVEVEGFRTTDPAFAAVESGEVTLWVDAKTRLPVRTEMDLHPNEHMHMQATVYDYQWDIPVSTGEFEPVIPKDYTTIPGGNIKLPKITEEAAIEGLQLFLDIAGHYPDKLDMMNLVQETVSCKDSNTPTAQQFRQRLEKAGSEEQRAAMVMEKMRPIQSLGMFYMTLVQDRKEPVYHGRSVTVGDADAVLLRWKTSEGHYRVIFGDLSTADVNAVELPELEGSQSQ